MAIEDTPLGHQWPRPGHAAEATAGGECCGEEQRSFYGSDINANGENARNILMASDVLTFMNGITFIDLDVKGYNQSYHMCIEV